MKAIIGHTGFVGSNLVNQIKFDHFYNSTNIYSINNFEYDEIFCAAPTAVKWKANKDQVNDLEKVFNLIKALDKVKTKKFFLFSTVDVYGELPFFNEDHVIDIKEIHPYGRNRYILETYIKNMFDAHIIRLPALFGNNLKKNIIFDLLNNNMVNNICLESSFQWLFLDRLKNILDFINTNNIKLFNCATEPVSNKQIVDLYFSKYKDTNFSNKSLKYNFSTKYFDTGYYLNSEEVLKDLGIFLNRYAINN
jgi:nucleoside-diphosphate-sugar epimerase